MLHKWNNFQWILYFSIWKQRNFCATVFELIIWSLSLKHAYLRMELTISIFALKLVDSTISSKKHCQQTIQYTSRYVQWWDHRWNLVSSSRSFGRRCIRVNIYSISLLFVRFSFCSNIFSLPSLTYHNSFFYFQIFLFVRISYNWKEKRFFMFYELQK